MSFLWSSDQMHPTPGFQNFPSRFLHFHIHTYMYSFHMCVFYVYICIGWKWNSRIAGVTGRSEVRSDRSRASWTFGREGEIWFPQASPSYWWVYSYYSRRQWYLLHSSSEIARWFITAYTYCIVYFYCITYMCHVCVHEHELYVWKLWYFKVYKFGKWGNI